MLKEGGGFMTLNFRKSLALILILALCVSFLSGCGSEVPPESSGETLWVVTEQSTSDGMNLQAQIIAERMEQSYPGLTVQLEILPLTTREREVRIKQLRSQIMSGKGPDVYLLPTGNQVITDFPFGWVREAKYTAIEPLFLDVPCSMKNGIFADMQPYWAADRELDTGELKPEIMSAGVMEGKRYVLPLRFTMPVILTTKDGWEHCGLSGESVTALTSTALSQENATIAACIRLPKDMTLLPEIFRYTDNRVSISANDIKEYMRLYQQWAAVSNQEVDTFLSRWKDDQVTRMVQSMMDQGTWIMERAIYRAQNSADGSMLMNYDDFNSILQYVLFGLYWETAGFPLCIANLPDSLEGLAISAIEGSHVEMYPLRAMDGTVTASVAYYGAVGSSCRKPALAYAFLRQFLTEEFQWDGCRPHPVRKTALMSLTWEPDCQTRGQIEDSWPVRTGGSTEHLWSSLRSQVMGIYNRFYRENESQRLTLELQKIQLTDEDVPALSWPIDEVRFPVTLPEKESFEHALSLLNEEDGTPTDVDIDALAQQVYQSLWFHLMEG